MKLIGPKKIMCFKFRSGISFSHKSFHQIIRDLGIRVMFFFCWWKEGKNMILIKTRYFQRRIIIINNIYAVKRNFVILIN